ncbi:MAG: PQQ-binding-like beta-propeller repeat protein [Candidatus Schekmanbacteria bacterium]|nr:PQQ-binding-like beta-propeller repeat protein [Candidatus Schekmanbacteria bacterium]
MDSGDTRRLTPASGHAEELFTLGGTLAFALTGVRPRLAYLLDGYPPPAELGGGVALSARTERLLLSLTAPGRMRLLVDRAAVLAAITGARAALDDPLDPGCSFTTFRGEARRNPALVAAALARDAPVEVTKRWEYRALGKIIGSPAQSRHTVIAGAQDGSLFALDAATGELLWRTALGAGTESTPVLTTEAAIVGTDGGQLVACARTSGAVRWRTAVSSGLVRSSPVLAAGSAPSVAGAAIAGTADGSLVAVSASSGEILWSRRLAGPCFSSPALGRAGAAAADRPLAVVGTDGKELAAVDAASGELSWRLRMPERVRATPCLATVAGRAVALVGAFDGTFCAVSLDRGEPLWRVEMGQRIYASAIWDETRGRGFVAGTDGRIVSLDEKGGLVAQAALGQVAATSPILLGDLLIQGGDDGRLAFYRSGDLALLRELRLGGPIRSCPIARPLFAGAAATASEATIAAATAAGTETPRRWFVTIAAGELLYGLEVQW